MKRISVIGTGYVGLVTGACLAELGNQVWCIDTDESKIAQLNNGTVPFFEPGLEELVERNSRSDRLHFGTSPAILNSCDIIFIAVGTPMRDDGHADLSYIQDAARTIARHIDGKRTYLIVNKSTVPIETGDLVASIIREHNSEAGDARVVSNPEFLREGNAIADFMQPDRIVLGVYDEESATIMRELYAPLGAPVIVTDVRTAEMIKYTANAFLATRVSFINEIAKVCEESGADIKDVVAGAGADKRIGTAFMSPGLGFGGSCFPKDVTALARIAEKHGISPRILDAVLSVNEEQVLRCVDRLESAMKSFEGSTVAVLGLAFKPNTDDIRESPAIRLVQMLLERGASVHAHDPAAAVNARLVLPPAVIYFADVYESLKGTDAMVVATDWNEYKQLDLELAARAMRGAILFDGRNIFDPALVRAANLKHYSVGRRSKNSQSLARALV
jgi:UDPglucose 6-dehydrogenase